MKRLTALLLALLLVVGLAACGTPDAPESPDPTDTTPVEPSPSPENSDPVDEPPAVELAGTMSQVVTVNLLGNDIPVDLVRNFETGAFRIDYQFNTNDVFAEGFVLEDGTWEITDTNNDFTFGTIEAVIPAIDDSAWVTADSELVVVVPSDDPEPTTDLEPSDDPAPVDPTAESVAQTVTVDMMGTATEVYVVKTGNHFEMSYTAMGNDVVLTGSIDGDTWTFETSNVEAVAAFAGNIVNSVVAALDESAWAPVVAEPVAQTVTVDMMGTATEVYVVKTGNHFEMSYSAMGNDVVLTGSIDGDAWTFETSNVEAVAAFAGNIVNSVAAAIDESAWAPVASEPPVAQTVTVDMMGNATEVYVVKTGNHFEMSYSAMGNDVVLTGSIDGNAWIFETSNVEAVAAFAGNIVNSVADAIDDAAWAPVE